MEQQLIHFLEQTQSSQEGPRKQAEQHLQVHLYVNTHSAYTDDAFRNSTTTQITH